MEIYFSAQVKSEYAVHACVGITYFQNFVF